MLIFFSRPDQTFISRRDVISYSLDAKHETKLLSYFTYYTATNSYHNLLPRICYMLNMSKGQSELDILVDFDRDIIYE